MPQRYIKMVSHVLVLFVIRILLYIYFGFVIYYLIKQVKKLPKAKGKGILDDNILWLTASVGLYIAMVLTSLIITHLPNPISDIVWWVVFLQLEAICFLNVKEGYIVSGILYLLTELIFFPVAWVPLVPTLLRPFLL